MKKIQTYIPPIATFFLPVFVLAQTIKIDNPTNVGNDFMSLLTAILNNVVMPIAAVAVVIWIIWAGFTYVTAQGNPAKVQQAHQRLLWSLIGAGILLGAAAISEVVQRTVEDILK